jgi:hypothetical protein
MFERGHAYEAEVTLGGAYAFLSFGIIYIVETTYYN